MEQDRRQDRERKWITVSATLNREQYQLYLRAKEKAGILRDSEAARMALLQWARKILNDE